MIEVFKTNVKKVKQSRKLVALLQQHFPGNKINFDLHDCDKVLRIEGESFKTEKVMWLIEENGFNCNVLE